MAHWNNVQPGQRGFTYIGVLFAVALTGVAMMLTAQVWRTTNQRAKEEQLLFVGSQYRNAIKRYYEGSPVNPGEYPKSLENLLRDPRYPDVRPYLRRLFPDPMTGKADWGLKRGPNGTITGVYSLSQEAPIRNFGTVAGIELDGRKKYSEWEFVHQPGSAATIVATAAAAGAAETSGGVAAAEQFPATAAQVEDPAARAARCQIINNLDLRYCAEQGNEFGRTYGDICRISAQARVAACNDGEGMPVLANQRPRGR